MAGKSRLLTVPTVNGEWLRRNVTWHQANGCLIIHLIRCTMSRSVRTCRTNWRVTSMGGLIWGTSIGGGNPMIAIWRGALFSSSFLIFCSSCWFLYYSIGIDNDNTPKILESALDSRQTNQGLWILNRLVCVLLALSFNLRPHFWIYTLVAFCASELNFVIYASIDLEWN